MGFFGAVGQVITNQKNFKQWEKEDANKQKQREILSQKDISPAVLQKAASKGKVIMDVVDIMDTHSEDVAENTETIIMPVAQSFPVLASIITLFAVGKFYSTPAELAHNKAVNNFINSDKGKEVFNIIEKLKEKSKNNPGSSLSKIKLSEFNFLLNILGKKLADFNKYDKDKIPTIFNKNNMKLISQSNDSEVRGFYSRLSEIGKDFANMKGIKNNSLGKIIGKSEGIIAGVSGTLFIAANIIAAKMQVKSSRIARWQSREDLSNPKYFVQYTDEQIQQAQKNINANKKEEPKGFSPFKNKKQNNNAFKHSGNNSFFKSLGSIIKDNKKYEEWKKNYNLEDKKVKRNLTPKEIEEAQKEQEVIQRITKIINNKAEEYSENMETTAGVLIGGTPFLGLGIGAIINTFMTKSGLGEKISTNKFNKLIKNIPDETKKEELTKLYQNLQSSQSKEVSGFVSNMEQKLKSTKNVGQYFEKMLETLAMKENFDNKNGINQAMITFKSMFNIIPTIKIGRNALIAFAGSMITGTVGSFIGLKLQKSAARAGRYKAKRELEENNKNFLGFSKKEFESVSDIKAEKKPLLKKVGEYLTFIPRVIKDYYEYENYNKTQAKNDKELLNELTKLNVTDKQLQEARELQRKLFTTFESVDDKSQEYSEAIEAISEMSQPLLPYIGIAIASIPLIIGGKNLAKGGKPKIAESITGFFAKHTKFLKGKTANKYMDNVAENIKGIIEKQNITQNSKTTTNNETLALFKNILQNNSGVNFVTEIQNAIKNAKGQENELKALINALADIPAFKKSINQEELNKGINELIQNMTELSQHLDLNKENFNPKEIQTILQPYLKDCTSISDFLKKILSNTEIPNIKLSEIADKTNIFKNINTKDIKNLKQSLKSTNIPGILNAIAEGKIQSGEWRTLLSKAEENLPEGIAQSIANRLVNSSMTNEQALKIYQNINAILKNIPKEELSKIIDITLEELNKNPDKFMQALQSGKLKNVFITKGVAVATVATPIVWNALTLLITFIIESTFASMQKQAGRLGVMKALEELQDESFYADMEPQNIDILQNNTTNQSTTIPQSSNQSQKSVNDIFNSLIHK